jgi:hypothetical protein
MRSRESPHLVPENKQAKNIPSPLILSLFQKGDENAV